MIHKKHDVKQHTVFLTHFYFVLTMPFESEYYFRCKANRAVICSCVYALLLSFCRYPVEPQRFVNSGPVAMTVATVFSVVSVALDELLVLMYSPLHVFARPYHFQNPNFSHCVNRWQPVVAVLPVLGYPFYDLKT